ncbi:MAG: hypothetical protein ACOC3T_03170, partial [Bacteroidota bacterium]
SRLEGGNAFELASQFDALGNSFNLSQHLFAGDYISEIRPVDEDLIKAISEASVNGNFSPEIFNIPRLSYGLSADYQVRESDEASLNLRNRLSGTVNDINITNTLTHQSIYNSALNTDSEDNFYGDLLMNSSNVFDVMGLSLRGTLSYSIKPDDELTKVAITSDYDINQETGLRFGASKNLTADKTTSLSAGINHDFETFAVSADTRYDDSGDFSIGMSLTVSFDFEGKDKTVNLYNRKNADKGLLTSRIYYDSNNNGIYDGADEPVKDAKLNLGRIITEEKTNENGFIHVADLQAYRPVNVSLDTGSLTEPFWRPINDGSKIFPRPGKSVQVDFPVVMTGEIDGTVYYEDGGELKEIANVQIHLIDELGNILKTEKTAFDGFNLFIDVMPGKYRLKIDEEQLKKFGLKPIGDHTAEIKNDGTILGGMDFYLSK